MVFLTNFAKVERKTPDVNNTAGSPFNSCCWVASVNDRCRRSANPGSIPDDSPQQIALSDAIFVPTQALRL